MAAAAPSAHASSPEGRRERRVAPASSRWSRPARPAPRIVRAAGARGWTASGDLYFDFDNRGGAVLLGHADPDVAVAVRRAEQASAASLKSALDERLLAMAPQAEAAAYGPNLAAGLAAALAAARTVTGRSLVFACDSCALSGAAGLPTFPWNDLDALDAALADKGRRTAALVLAPLSETPAVPGYLAGVRRLADAHGVLLIFDEAASGFRIHNGGAQGLFGVRADLAVYGDSLANGEPFTAVAGRGDLVAALRLDDPSTPALAAAAAVIDKVERQSVVACLRVRGAEVQAEVGAAIEIAGAEDFVQVCGDPALSSLAFTSCGAIDALAMKRFWIREAADHRLISAAAHIMSFAHGDAEIEALIAASGEIARRLVEAIHADAVASAPPSPASPPPFTVQ